MPLMLSEEPAQDRSGVASEWNPEASDRVSPTSPVRLA